MRFRCQICGIEADTRQAIRAHVRKHGKNHGWSKSEATNIMQLPQYPNEAGFANYRPKTITLAEQMAEKIEETKKRLEEWKARWA
jgi:hypothetical protein